MSNHPPSFSDSPRGSAFLPLSPPSPLQQTHAPESSDSSSSDKLSELPGKAIPRSPYHSVRNELTVIPASSSAPSLQGLVGTRPFPASPEGYDVRQIMTEGSRSLNSSIRRVSFDGNPTFISTPSHSPRTKVHVHPLLREAVSPNSRGIEPTITRIVQSTDPARPLSSVRLPAATNSPMKPSHETPMTTSASQSRATSPLRRFGWSGFHRTHEDAFIPVDPFQLRPRRRRFSLYSSDAENNIPFDSTCEANPICCVAPLYCNAEKSLMSLLRDVRYFILDTLPRQIYLTMLLRIPASYFSRIAKAYEDAQLSKPDLERMIESYSSSYQREERERILRSSPIPPGAHYHPDPILPLPEEWTTANVSPALVRFKQSWETFIDSLLREWKTLNLVSALLHSAIISMFQIQNMANDPVIRTAALLSLISAMISLSFGCIYIVRFGTMRSMDKATRWAEEATRTTTFILWNVWVLLAMPAVWLAWSMIFFITAILAFVWRDGSSADPASPQPLSPTAALGPRIAISALFFLGLLYLAAIIKTLHNYGKATDGRISGRMTVRGGTPSDRLEDDSRERGRGTQRGRGRSFSGRDGDRGHESTPASRGRDHDKNRVEHGPLSAVTGLGLTGIHDLASPRSSDEISEKQRYQIEGNTV